MIKRILVLSMLLVIVGCEPEQSTVKYTIVATPVEPKLTQNSSMSCSQRPDVASKIVATTFDDMGFWNWLQNGTTIMKTKSIASRGDALGAHISAVTSNDARIDVNCKLSEDGHTTVEVLSSLNDMEQAYVISQVRKALGAGPVSSR